MPEALLCKVCASQLSCEAPTVVSSNLDSGIAQVAALLASMAAATRLEQEKEREQATLLQQIDEANAAAEGLALGEISSGTVLTSALASVDDEEEVPSALARLDEIEAKMEGFQVRSDGTARF
eukprot:scaffold228764_cov29-Tisochrysis_lutea.AAC.2